MDTTSSGQHLPVPVVLWLLAVIAIDSGIVSTVRGQVLTGLALVMLGLLLGAGRAPVVRR